MSTPIQVHKVVAYFNDTRTVRSVPYDSLDTSPQVHIIDSGSGVNHPYQSGDYIVGHLRSQRWHESFGIVSTSNIKLAPVLEHQLEGVFRAPSRSPLGEHDISRKLAVARPIMKYIETKLKDVSLNELVLPLTAEIKSNLFHLIPKLRQKYFCDTVIRHLNKQFKRQFSLLGVNISDLSDTHLPAQTGDKRFTLRLNPDTCYLSILQQPYRYPALSPGIADKLTMLFSGSRTRSFLAHERLWYIASRAVHTMTKQMGDTFCYLDELVHHLDPGETGYYPDISGLLISVATEPTSPLIININKRTIKLKITDLRERTIARDLVRLNELPVESWREIEPSDIRQKLSQTGQVTLYNENQINAINMILSHRVGMIIGEGGTGKSATLGHTNYLIKTSDKDTEAIFLTFAGKAAARLKEANIPQAMTMHSFIYRGMRIFGNNSARKNTARPTRAVVVIDEASMVPMAILADVLNILFELYKTRFSLFFVGDDAQLPPIGSCHMMHIFRQITWMRIIELTINYRVKDKGSSIILNAHYVRSQGKSPSVAPGELDQPTGFRVIPGKFEVMDGNVETVLAVYQLNFEKFHTSVVVTPRVVDRDKLNMELQKHYLDKFVTKREQVVSLGNRVILYVKDRVYQTRNCYASDLKIHYDTHGRFERFEGVMVMNGDSGVIGEIRGKGFTVQQKNISEPQKNGVEYPAIEREYSTIPDIGDGHSPSSRLHCGDLSLFYSGTGHVLQGSELSAGIIYVPMAAYFDGRWLYTAITRFKDQVIIIGDKRAIRKMIQQPVPPIRQEIGLLVAMMDEWEI